MSRWFRHYAGMMRDDKLVRVAIQSKQSVERVLWVWGAILESAAEINDGGNFDFDAGEAAYFLRADEADIGSIVSTLETMGRIHAGCVVKWGDRQFQSDASAERQKRYRERRKTARDNLRVTGGDVTKTSRDAEVTLQETETEAYTETEQRINEPKGSSRANVRGSRLPDSWLPDEVFAASEGMTAAETAREAEKFRDYWRQQPGQKGVKLDWSLTWKNWVRRFTDGRQKAPERKYANWRDDPIYRNVL